MYQYAFGLLIGQAVNILIACLLAAAFQEYMTVFVFLLSFIPLRSYAGGHHADNYTICTLLSTLILLGVCVMAKLIPAGIILTGSLISGAVCGFLIFLLAPVEDRNKPLDQAERRRYGRRSKVIWTFEDVSLAIALGHLALSILLCAGTVKNKKISHSVLNQN